MAKESGISMTAAIDDGAGTSRTLTDDITNLTLGIPRGLQDVSGLADAGLERILLLGDLSIPITGVFNPAANMSHAAFKTVPSQTADRERDISIAISAQTLTAKATLGDYVLTRGADGSFTWTVTLVNQDGVVPAWS